VDLRRVRVWEWLTGLAGVTLLVSLFLPWYGAGDATATAWESLTVTDVVLGLVALMAIALPVLTATQRTVAVPQSWTALIMLVVVPALLMMLFRLLNLPGDGLQREIGVWLGALATAAVFAFDYRSMGDSSFPRAMRPRLDIETIPAPTPDGGRRDVTQ
jgi:cytochrome bd-type quinol oxidase subunit 2